MLEQIIAYHCAPAMAGIKASNLVSLSHKDYPDISNQLIELNDKLNTKDIYFKVIFNDSSRVLLLVYRKIKLYKLLNEDVIKEFLLKYNYPINKSMDNILSFLGQRISSSNTFPHEIGVFLGYPIEDILGFLNNNVIITLLQDIGKYTIKQKKR